MNMQVNKFKRNILSVMLIAFSLLCFACENSLDSKEDVIKYINKPENGLQKTEKLGDVEVKLSYQPWELIASRLSSVKKEEELKKYADKSFFILSFSKNNKELLRQLDFNTYSEMVQVFAFRMPAYISLLTSGAAPVPPDDCLFQQTYGASNANSILLIFKKKDVERADKFKIRVQEFGLGLGNITYNLNKEDLEKIPAIEIKNL